MIRTLQNTRRRPATTTRRLGAPALAFLAALGSTPITAVAAEYPVPPRNPNPLEGVRFHVDARSSAREQAAAWRGSRPSDAALMEYIAGQPQADWYGDWNRDVRGDVENRLQDIDAGATPLFVAYNIPHRDCGLHSSGGADDASAYRRWIRALADGIGDRRAVVVLEPDALAGMDCLPDETQRERVALLADAVQVLSARSGVSVYVDAGNARWKSVGTMADRLRRVGVTSAAGFALNVSNFIDDDQNLAYGDRLSAALDGAHYVVDSSRNGAGATGDNEWCNPEGRALGRAPTWDTGHEGLDAWLWVKRPGESDGRCNGGPSAGKWWADYALGLARRAGPTRMAAAG